MYNIEIVIFVRRARTIDFIARVTNRFFGLFLAVVAKCLVSRTCARLVFSSLTSQVIAYFFQMNRLCLNCNRMEQTECECPCECSLYSAECVQPNISNLETCTAPYEQGFSSNADWSQLTALKPCPVFNCKNYETKGECMGIVGCQWCSVDSDGESMLERPFCSDMNLCFKGILGSFLPYADGSYSKSIRN